MFLQKVIQLLLGFCQITLILSGFACLRGPCLNGICIDELNSTHQCYCIDGFTGYSCEINWNECNVEPCRNGGTCLDGIATFNCSCPENFGGTLCEYDLSECRAFRNCQNGGTCSFDPNLIVSGRNGSGFYCACPKGYTGELCEKVTICNATENPCRNGKCVDGQCVCLPGYVGTYCEKDYDECSSSPCQNGGICIDSVNDFKCACPFSYTGKFCESKLQICEVNPCKNGGFCLEEHGRQTCYCVPDYHGKYCEEKYNECEGPGQKCFNGGTCIDGVGGFNCSCPPNFYGDRCQCEVNSTDPECQLPTPSPSEPSWNETISETLPPIWTSTVTRVYPTPTVTLLPTTGPDESDELPTPTPTPTPVDQTEGFPSVSETEWVDYTPTTTVLTSSLESESDTATPTETLLQPISPTVYPSPTTLMSPGETTDVVEETPAIEPSLTTTVDWSYTPEPSEDFETVTPSPTVSSEVVPTPSLSDDLVSSDDMASSSTLSSIVDYETISFTPSATVQPQPSATVTGPWEVTTPMNNETSSTEPPTTTTETTTETDIDVPSPSTTPSQENVTTQLSPITPVTTEIPPVTPVTTEIPPVTSVTTEMSPATPATTEMSPDTPATTEMSSDEPVTTEMSPVTPVTTEMSPVTPVTTEMSSSEPVTTVMSPVTPIENRTSIEITSQIPPKSSESTAPSTENGTTEQIVTGMSPMTTRSVENRTTEENVMYTSMEPKTEMGSSITTQVTTDASPLTSTPHASTSATDHSEEPSETPLTTFMTQSTSSTTPETRVSFPGTIDTSTTAKDSVITSSTPSGSTPTTVTPADSLTTTAQISLEPPRVNDTSTTTEVTTELSSYSPALGSTTSSPVVGSTTFAPVSGSTTSSPTLELTTTTTTAPTNDSSTVDPCYNYCQNSAKCILSALGPICLCPFKFSGKQCELNSEKVQVPALRGNSFLKYKVPRQARNLVNISLKMATVVLDGIVLYTSSFPKSSNSNVIGTYALVFIQNGHLVLHFSCGSQSMEFVETRTRVNNGYNFTAKLDLGTKLGNGTEVYCVGKLSLNGSAFVMSGEQLVGNSTRPRFDSIFIGGVDSNLRDDSGSSALAFIPGLRGCLSGISINAQYMDMFDDAEDGADITECDTFACVTNPCFGTAQCVPSTTPPFWECICPTGYEGWRCQTKICPKPNICQNDATCTYSPPLNSTRAEVNMSCLCALGFTGKTCATRINITKPSFYPTKHYASYISYYGLPHLHDWFQFKFHFVTTNLSQIALLLYIGNPIITPKITLSQLDQIESPVPSAITMTTTPNPFMNDSSSIRDFFSLSFLQGLIGLTWNLGSGSRRIVTPSKIDTRLQIHTIYFGRSGRHAWVKVDGMRNITGRSPGPMSELNVDEEIYVGGHERWEFEGLPHDLPLHTGFQGCIFDLGLRVKNKLFLPKPFKGRNVKNCFEVADC